MMDKEDIKIKLGFQLSMSITSLVIGSLIYMTDCLGDLFCETLRNVSYLILGVGIISLIVSIGLLYLFCSFDKDKQTTQQSNTGVMQK